MNVDKGSSVGEPSAEQGPESKPNQERGRQNESALKNESATLPTRWGVFQMTVHPDPDGREHCHLVMGDVAGQQDVLVRIHSECLTGDVFSSKRCDCGEQLDLAMKEISAAGLGMLIYLRQEGRGIGLAPKMASYRLQDQGFDTVDANLQLGFEADLRSYDLAARVIQAANVGSIRLMTNNPEKVKGMEDTGVVVSKVVPLLAKITDDNQRYLATKAKRFGHKLPLG